MTVNKNHLFLWIISGILGVMIRDLYSLTIFLTHLVKLPIWTIAADLFIDRPEFHTFLGIAIGLIADLCIGGTLGIFIGIGVDWQERKNYLWIGLGVGIAAWLMLYGGMLHNLPQTMKNAPHDAFTTVLALIGHEIYGFVTAWIYVKLLDLRAGEAKVV